MVSLSLPILVSAAGTALIGQYAFVNQQCGKHSNLKAYPGIGNSTLSGLCCSQWNDAGVTTDHCLLENGCQPDWGRCHSKQAADDNSTLPTVYTKCVIPGHAHIAFDDGPSLYDDSLLDYLKAENISASFYLNGDPWKSVFQGLPTPGIFALNATVKRMYDDGHQLCSHTWSHTDLITSGQYNATYELATLNTAFASILGVVPKCVRPPYGDFDSPSLRVMQGLGYGEDSGGAIIMWNLDEVDWDPSSYGPNISTQIKGMTDGLKEDVTTGNDTSWITLNHDIWKSTADFRKDGDILSKGLVPFTKKTVDFFRSKNIKIVSLETCLGRLPGSLYRAVDGNDQFCGTTRCSQFLSNPVASGSGELFSTVAVVLQIALLIVVQIFLPV